MCAALSSYVFACAANGVLLNDWRDRICCECAVSRQGSLLQMTHPHVNRLDPVPWEQGGTWDP